MCCDEGRSEEWAKGEGRRARGEGRVGEWESGRARMGGIGLATCWWIQKRNPPVVPLLMEKGDSKRGGK